MNPDGTQDSNLLNIRVEDGPVQDFRGVLLQPEPGVRRTGIVKYSGKQKGPVTLLIGTAVAGIETVIDINDEACNLRIEAALLDMALSKYGISIKGGACGHYIRAIIRGRSRECEVFFDNWSDQSHLPCTNNVLDLRPEDGKTPIRVRYLLNPPILAPGSGPYEFIFPGPHVPLPRWVVYKGFNELRRHAWTAKRFGLT